MTITRPGHTHAWCDAIPTSSDVYPLVDSDWNAGQAEFASAPSRQRMNGIFRTLHSHGLYNLEGGAPEWNADSPYRVDALVSYNGALYRALVARAAGAMAPSLDTTNWHQLGYCVFSPLYTPGTTTFVVPPNVNKIRVWGVGGGGGGAGGGSVSTALTGGPGGGGAQHSECTLIVVPGDTITVVVGAGGAGGTASSSPAFHGGNGGDSSITAPLTTTTITFPGARGARCGSKGGYTPDNGVIIFGGAPSAAQERGLITNIDSIGNGYGYVDPTSTAYPLWLQYLRQAPGFGGPGGFDSDTLTDTTAQAHIARAGGDSNGNPGGLWGSAGGTTYGRYGGGGGGASSWPRMFRDNNAGGAGGYPVSGHQHGGPGNGPGDGGGGAAGYTDAVGGNGFSGAVIVSWELF